MMQSFNHQADRPKVYPSKIDLWIATMLLTAPLSSLILGLYLLAEGNPQDAAILFGVALIVCLISAVFTLPCRYTIEAQTLHIRCGIIRSKVPLADIEQINKSSSWLSGPALSMKRVLVSANRKDYLISPNERDEFIAELENAVAQARQNHA
ncbi:MAG: PH domain-containing protein [Rubripirellula sp.]|nr:PH domain-containing protein [Rubripirellula sp.]